MSQNYLLDTPANWFFRRKVPPDLRNIFDIHPREVFKTALVSNAAALVLIHNHPSGDPSLSSEDIAITRRLKEAGDLLGIKVMDHVIVGADGRVSLLERGVM